MILTGLFGRFLNGLYKVRITFRLKKRMIVFILFSVLVAALGIAYLQLKYSMSHGPTTTYLQALKAKQKVETPSLNPNILSTSIKKEPLKEVTE